MRLDKFLSDMGAGTRSNIKKAIRSGRVQVDNTVIREPSFSVTAASSVMLDHTPVRYEEYEYYMLNKPAGVISASEDSRQKTVLDLIREPTRRDLFPVGRLDKDTVGLLLLTNDGALAHRLLSPKSHVEKTYYARVSGEVTAEDVAAFSKGLRIDDTFTALPARLTILSPSHPISSSDSPSISEVEITIHEGKFHQIKRMFLAVDKEVVYLKRLSMCTLHLDESLPEGAYRRLTGEELQMLRQFS